MSRLQPIKIPWQPNPLGLPLGRQFLDSSAIHIALRSWYQHHEALGKDIRRQLIRRPDGSLTFLNGRPVRKDELLPGARYDIVDKPWVQ